MADANGFRNVLVHGYAEVDDRLVISVLANFECLENFVASVSHWGYSPRRSDHAGTPCESMGQWC